MAEIPVTHHKRYCHCMVCDSNDLTVYRVFKYMVEHLGDPEQAARYEAIGSLFPE